MTPLVSIHAPWEGCDVSDKKYIPLRYGFNSRTLGRVRRVCLCKIFLDLGFNSRTLGRVRPRLMMVVLLRERSFNSRTLGRVRHSSGVEGLCSCDSFNSRTLGRVRLMSHIAGIIFRTFQFTHPGKGATTLLAKFRTYSRVSIHAPWEGCDVNCSILSPFFL